MNRIPLSNPGRTRRPPEPTPQRLELTLELPEHRERRNNRTSPAGGPESATKDETERGVAVVDFYV